MPLEDPDYPGVRDPRRLRAWARGLVVLACLGTLFAVAALCLAARLRHEGKVDLLDVALLLLVVLSCIAWLLFGRRDLERAAPSDAVLGNLALVGLGALRAWAGMGQFDEPAAFLPRLTWRLGVLFLLWWGVMLAGGLWLRFTGADEGRGRIIR